MGRGPVCQDAQMSWLMEKTGVKAALKQKVMVRRSGPALLSAPRTGAFGGIT